MLLVKPVITITLFLSFIHALKANEILREVWWIGREVFKLKL
jgi:hypothetical protein